MTPERIAELRDDINGWCGESGDCDCTFRRIAECLDSIERLTAERDALRDATRWRLVTDTEPAIGDAVEGLWLANTQGDVLRSGVHGWDALDRPGCAEPDAWRPFVPGELPPELAPPE